MKSIPLILVWCNLAIAVASAHPAHENSPVELAQAPGVAARGVPPEPSRVSITTNGGFRHITANGVPDHEPGVFPNRGNPNAIAVQNHTFRMPLSPRTNAVLRSIRGDWFGVALNGVPFEPGTAEFWNGQREWNYEAKGGFVDLGLDAHNAHVQPTGAYHYHGLPVGLKSLRNGNAKRPALLGYAADGFPIYSASGFAPGTNAASPGPSCRSSWRLKQGLRPGGPGGAYDGRFTADYEFVSGSGDLDECNGRFGATPEYPQGTYYYCITEEFPYIARSWRGTPDQSFFKPRRGGPGGPPPGRPPPGAAAPPRRS
jgi:hypothetical protein